MHMEKQTFKNMLNRKNMLIGLCVITVLALLFLIRRSYKKDEQKPAVQSRIEGSSDPLPQENVVVVTDKGFSPDTITITKDSAVRWKNASGEDASVNSDNYPSNKLYPFLNLGKFKDGQTMIYIFKEAGKFTYHNHFHSEEKGTVIVE